MLLISLKKKKGLLPSKQYDLKQTEENTLQKLCFIKSMQAPRKTGFLSLQRKVYHGLDSPALTFKGFKIWNHNKSLKKQKQIKSKN